jgi:hypothetical protein
MADIVYGIAPQVRTYTSWTSLNPTLGRVGYGQVVIATGSDFGDILVWGANQTFNTAYAAGQWMQGVGAKSLTKGRVSDKELPTVGLSGDDWYTIAEFEGGTSGTVPFGISTFYILVTGNSSSRETAIINVGFHNESVSRDHGNTLIELLGGSSAQSSGAFTVIKGARLICKDGDVTAGAKLQIYVDDAVGFNTFVRKIGNLSTRNSGDIDIIGTLPGWTIVSTTSTNNTLCPDGTTTADTFLVAGEYYDFLTDSTSGMTGWTAYRVSADAIRVTVDWEQIVNPLVSPGSIPTVTYPSSIFRVMDNGTFVDIDNTFSYLVRSVTGKRVVIEISKTGAFTTLASNTLFGIWISGTGGSFTIST